VRASIRVGSTFGLGLLWTALVPLPLMAGVQEGRDRTALATGETLGELCTPGATALGQAGANAMHTLVLVALGLATVLLVLVGGATL
jgi:hypothetical protein